MIGFIADMDVNDMCLFIRRINDIKRLQDEIEYERINKNRPTAIQKFEARITRLRKEQTPRYRRLDLINSMPHGEQARIARILKCSQGHVSEVLNGHKQQTNDLSRNIIRLAERAAEIELGKQALSRFKKFRV